MQPVRPSTLTSSGTALDPSLSLRPGPARVADSGWRCQMPPASPTAVALGQGCTISEHLGRDGREPPSETVLDMVPTRQALEWNCRAVWCAWQPPHPGLALEIQGPGSR
jgi:hypothetical protein